MMRVRLPRISPGLIVSAAFVAGFCSFFAGLWLVAPPLALGVGGVVVMTVSALYNYKPKGRA